VARNSALQAIFVARYHDAMKPKQPTKRGPGRPPVLEGEATVTMNIRMTEAQRAKVERNGGGPWVRKLIDKARNTS
jgi:hypothetical protein